MHAARLKFESDPIVAFRGTALAPAYVGCSGWFYWNWRGLFYPADLPTGSWFTHYAKRFDTVEINASFYSWPTLANIQAWKRQAGKRKFVYTVKDCELITHAKRFKGTKTLVKDFGLIADILGEGWAASCFSCRPAFTIASTDGEGTYPNFGATCVSGIKAYCCRLTFPRQ